MGGRGGKSGLSTGGGYGGYGSLQGLINAVGSGLDLYYDVNTDPTKRGDWDDNGNPQIVKYQGQEDDKTANFLASTDRNIDLNDPQYADGYEYYDVPLNKLLLRTGVVGQPIVLSDSDFRSLVAQTGAQVVYRGWSGKASADRFMNATHNHVGNGIFGDGYYFSPDRYVADQYAGSSGVVTKMILNPLKARAIDLTTLQTMMRSASPKLQSSLRMTGSGANRTYGNNDGEMQYALKMGYNVIVSGNYVVGGTADAFIVSKKYG
jgi:hypothetical protein